MWMITPRDLYVDLIYPKSQMCLKFIVPRPIRIPQDWYSLSQQFQSITWILILVSFLIAAAMCCLSIKLFSNIYGIQYNNIEMYNILFVLFSISITPNSIPKNAITKYSFILLCWSIYSFLITSMYQTFLISFLTIESHTPRIDTDEDFVRENLTWGSIDDKISSYILNLNIPNQQKMFKNFIYESFEQKNLVYDHINSGRYAMLISEYSYRVPTIIKSIDEIPPFMNYRIMKRECFYTPYLALMFRLNSPYRQAFEKYHNYMFETGILLKITRDEVRKIYPNNWESIYYEFDEHLTNEPQVLGLENLIGAFILLFIGYGISMLGFIWEIWRNFYQTRILAF